MFGDSFNPLDVLGDSQIGVELSIGSHSITIDVKRARYSQYIPDKMNRQILCRDLRFSKYEA